jgi:hypothetical protein
VAFTTYFFPSLTGEDLYAGHLTSYIGVLQLNAVCDVDSSSIDYEVNGRATGPYEGSFALVGHVKLGADLPGQNPAQPIKQKSVERYEGTFNIEATDATIEGRLLTTTGWGLCFDDSANTGDTWLALQNSAGTFGATISSDIGQGRRATCKDGGTVLVNFRWDEQVSMQQQAFWASRVQMSSNYAGLQYQAGVSVVLRPPRRERDPDGWPF